MKTERSFSIFLITAILFSFMLNGTNVAAGESGNTASSSSGGQSEGEKQIIAEIQTGEEANAIKERQVLFQHFSGLFEFIEKVMKDPKVTSPFYVNTFSDQYKNQETKLPAFKENIANAVELYYRAYFDPHRLSEVVVESPKKNDDKLETKQPNGNDGTKGGTENQDIDTLIDEIADRILQICVHIKDDDSCSSSIVTDSGPTRDYMHQIYQMARGDERIDQTELDFNQNCGPDI